MTTRRLIAAAAVAALAAACSPKAANQTSATAQAPSAGPAAPAAPSQTGEPVITTPPGKTDAPAGAYTLDTHHSTMVWRVDHLAFSHFRGQFTKLAGTLNFDPAHPEAMSVTATADPASMLIPDPPAGFRDTLLGKTWLDAKAFPTITFRSTKVAQTGPNTADVTGDLTLHGVTKPITLQAIFNGGYPANAFDGARVGISAHGFLRRSDFGIAYGLPAPGTNMGVGDRVDFTIETEWNMGKPTAPAPGAAPPPK